MRVTTKYVDIRKQLERGEQPCVFVVRSADDRAAWHIRQNPIDQDATRGWSVDLRSERVRVPLFGYALAAADALTLLRFALQAGIVASRVVPAGVTPDGLFLAVGDIFGVGAQQDEPRAYLGVAFKAEQ